MTSINIPLDSFPIVDPAKKTLWAPILCHPKEASWEKLVVGIVAIDGDGFHIEVANRLSRLGCLYEERAMPIALSIEIAISWLEEVLCQGNQELSKIVLPVANISLGGAEEAVGLPCREVAEQWMASLSSLHADSEPNRQGLVVDTLSEAKSSIAARPLRLPVRVLSMIEKRDPSLLEFFHEDVRNRRTRRRRANARIKIDYNGRNLSANIDNFNVDSPASTVGILKQRMWDLAIERERGVRGSDLQRAFEMLVDFPQHRALDKRPSSVERIQEHLRELTEQADSEEIRLRTMSGAQQIGEHILAREVA